MNPRRLLPIAAAVLLAATGAGWYFTRGAAPAEKKGPPPVPVLMAKAALRDLPLTLELTGRAEAFESVSLKARVDGQVQTVLFTEGRHVAQGEVLLRLDPADYEARLRQAEAALARDQAQFVKAQADVERAVSLKARGFVSDAAIDTARAAASGAEATVKSDQAALDLARLQLGYTTVRAPFDGIVGARLVFPGTAVKANDTTLAVVNRVRPIFVSFAVPEKYLPRLRTGMKGKGAAVTVSVPGDKTPMSGTIRFLDNAVDATTGTVQMKAQLANEGERLSPGQFVDVSLGIETLAQAVTVPNEAIQQGPSGSYVYIVKDDQTVEMRKLTLAATQHGIAAIREGLAAGETVVTDGQLRLVPGARVRPADAKPRQ
ncbi:MAG: efflux RND transporter periplasmic adaptor subunit [Rhodocyclales bacterium]|nr:efflux RND transporter periplasmic adaptor subunit [Rhodocyclales bacterium]